MQRLSPGIYLAHKPPGASSFDAVRAFKRVALDTGQKKWPLGHGGTLDPFAHGLLPILSGQATRLMELLHPLPKVYEAALEWGMETDTCDHLGSVLTVGDVCGLIEGDLASILTGFMGWSDQVPPATCAKKIGGEAAYKKAHRGEEVTLPPSRVYLHEAAWVSHSLPRRSRLRITCRGGFYVRSLARDLGRKLGCGAHLSELRRVSIGPWADPGPSQQPASPDSQPGTMRGQTPASACPLIAGEALIPWCRRRFLDQGEADHLAHGRPIHVGGVADATYALPKGFPDPQGPIAAFLESRLVALLVERNGMLWATANLRGGL